MKMGDTKSTATSRYHHTVTDGRDELRFARQTINTLIICGRDTNFWQENFFHSKGMGLCLGRHLLLPKSAGLDGMGQDSWRITEKRLYESRSRG